ncbi:MAG: hypothetical protein EXR43_03125 [Dehalococcoidia bacterium]|nr:hypothetical protein [Dehalococcoidia bacterium]
MSPRHRKPTPDTPTTLLGRIGLNRWMLSIALIAPLGYAAYRAAADESVGAFLGALLWPGALLYVITVGVLWMGWTANLDQ